MNTRAKGNRNRRKAEEWLKTKYPNCKISTVENSAPFAKERDCFGLFDLLVANKRQLILVQVTTNRPHTHQLYINWSKTHTYVLQLVWYDRKGWMLHEYKHGIKTTTDLRK